MKNRYLDGRQVVYVPDHIGHLPLEEILKHPQTEFGFLYGNPSDGNWNDYLSVRYFAKFSFPIKETDELPDLRTKANGEKTVSTNLFYVNSVPQDYVDEWVDTLGESGQ